MVSFSQSLRAIQRDRARAFRIALSVLAVLFLAWAIWFFRAPLLVVEVSDSARLEMDKGTHPIQSQVEGRVIATTLALGRTVRAGEILVELDATVPRTELQEARSRLDTALPQIERIMSEVAAKERALREDEQASQAAHQEALEREREARALAEYAAGQASRAEELHSRGLFSRAEMLRAKAEAENSRAAAHARELAVTRTLLESKSRRSDREAEIQELRRDALDLERERERSRSTIERLENAVERYRLRATVDGRIAEVADVRVGSMLPANRQVGVVVRRAPFRVVAHFHPEDAAGRIVPGQRARLRLAGFPWIQFGSVPLRVDAVASEVREERIRVELSVLERSTRIPLQHGLPGSVEVTVDRVTPAALALRAVGKTLGEPVKPRREPARL